MNKPIRCIDAICHALQTSETSDPDSLVALAEEYSGLCRQANERLRHVAELLKKGLRAEAIQAAEREPKLLDFVIALDFPELDYWVDLLRYWQIEPPPRLFMEIAAELDAAYGDQLPLEGLLRKHRLLALERAPLPMRLQVLRQIREMDPMNVAWATDIEDWERARLKQIALEADGLIKKGNLDGLARLHEELKSGNWSVVPPADLIRKVASSQSAATANLAKRELEKLVPSLNQAYMELDIAAGRSLRVKFEHLALKAELGPSDPIRESVSEAIQWLNQADQADRREAGFKQAVAALEQALDKGATPTEIDRLYYAATQFDLEIPAILRNRVVSNKQDAQAASQRRSLLLVAVAVILVGAIGAGVFVAIRSSQNAADVASDLKTLQQMHGEKKYAEAMTYFEKLPDWRKAVSATAAEKASIETDMTTEKNRRDEFIAAIAAAEKAGVDSPDMASIAKAKQIAALDDERERITSLERAVATRQAKLQSDRDQKYLSEIAKFEGEVEKLTKSPQATESAVDRLQQEIEKLASENLGSINGYDKVSKNVRDRSEPLVKTLRSFRQELSVKMDQEKTLESVVQQVGNVATYFDALKSFAESAPSHRYAADFLKVQDEKDYLDCFLAWQKFYARQEFSRIDALATIDADALLKISDEMQGKFPISEFANDYARKEGYLKAILKRGIGTEKDLAKSTGDLFRDPLVANLFVVIDKDGNTYYTSTKPLIGSGKHVDIEYIIDTNISTEKKKFLVENITKYGQAPQSILAETCLEEWKSLSSAGWEKTYLKLIDLLAHPPKETDGFTLDPIIQASMLKKIFQSGVDGSETLGRSLPKHRDIVSKMKLDAPRTWMNPKNTSVKDTRVFAEQFIQAFNQIPIDTEKVLAEAAESQEVYAKPFKWKDVVWVGWAAKSDAINWSIRSSNPLADGKLYCLAMRPPVEVGADGGSSNPIVQFIEVGSVSGNQVQLKGDELLNGRPIFWIAADKVPEGGQ